VRLAVTTLLLVGCASPSDPPGPPPSSPITTATFNTAGPMIDDPVAGPAIANQLAAIQPDFAEIEECECDSLLAKLPAGYALVSGSESSEVGILYASDRWEQLDHGVLQFGDDDGWGPRLARWARMGDRNSDAEIYVYATHLCVPIRTDDDRCDTDRQLGYAKRIADDMASRAQAAVLGGDLNVFDGFEHGPVISYLRDAGLVDTLRAITPDDVSTFEGNDWAPPGRIDYVFASQPVTVLAATVATDFASDHRAVSATLLFAPQ
jgi:endonuclease/exonuclease/phosphatase family metal-dependent hydrolase